jgi:hypothetical protein
MGVQAWGMTETSPLGAQDYNKATHLSENEKIRHSC